MPETTVTMSNAPDDRRLFVVNNTSVDLRPFWPEVAKSIRETGAMPDALADVLKVRHIRGNRFAVEYV